jgi:hypothetical protein
MSVSMTLPAVRRRQKLVTRRHVDSWKNLKPGDFLELIEKGMGLPKGAKQVVVARVQIIDVRVEAVGHIADELDGTFLEGLEDMLPSEFVRFWLKGHGYDVADGPETLCRRIEWRYV